MLRLRKAAASEAACLDSDSEAALLFLQWTETPRTEHRWDLMRIVGTSKKSNCTIRKSSSASTTLWRIVTWQADLHPPKSGDDLLVGASRPTRPSAHPTHRPLGAASGEAQC